MSDALSFFEQRQSCRKFDSQQAVEREKLTTILECARIAPSACNGQPWRFVAVDEPQRLEQLALCMQEGGLNAFANDAGAFIVVIEEKGNISSIVGGAIKNQHFSGLDIGIAVSHIMIAAQMQGLSSCAIGWFNERKIKMLLKIPKTKRIRLIVALGYAQKDDAQRPKLRKPMEEIVSFNKY